jgi:hypothetical protein
MLKRLLTSALDLRGETPRHDPAAHRAMFLAAKLNIARVRNLPENAPVADAEFQVFSQWGEDGIIQYLLSRIGAPSPTFVEFGVENYLESNTRFLLMNDNWRGLVLDSSQRHIDFIKSDDISWRHDLDAQCAFITTDNINDLIARRFPDDTLGLLSIDIDGNDYWVWRAIRTRPAIVICEYNSVLGPRAAVTIPYQPDFTRHAAHHSGLYWGASLAAFCRLADDKGYAFVGSNSAGVNAFFVRRDLLRALKPLTPAEGYVESRFRDSRDANGELSYLSGRDRLRAIADLPMVEHSSGEARPIRELLAPEIAAPFSNPSCPARASVV